MAARKPKVITNEKDIDYIAHITEDDITTTFIMENFGEFNDKVRFNTYDEITIPVGCYGNHGELNKNPFVTTVGTYVYNKYFIERDLFNIFHYINEEITDGMYENINSDLSYALLEDEITVEQFKRYEKKVQKFMPYVAILSPSYSDKFLTCTTEINKKKNQLIKKYEKELAEGNEVIASQIENELLEFAQEYLKDDPAMDSFLSGGASGSMGNNFKNLFIMKGAVKDPDPNAKQKYKIATSNYMDGIKPEEYAIFANSLAAGPFSRAKKTEVGGYLEKVFLYAYQHIKLDPAGSDCGTKRTITIEITKKNIADWMYSYVVGNNGQLTEITSKNKDKFIGKKVKIRYSALCESKTGICNKCFGNLPYRRGNLNSGIESTIIPSTMKNRSMKAFHDSVQKTRIIDINKAFKFN